MENVCYCKTGMAFICSNTNTELWQWKCVKKVITVTQYSHKNWVPSYNKDANIYQLTEKLGWLYETVYYQKSSTKKQSAIMKQISRKRVTTLKTDEITAF